MENQFRPFDPEEPVRTSYRHLPHWEQDGATYFVTFRTADSLPVERLESLEKERELWRRFHPPPWSDGDYDDYCRLMFHKLDGWLDQQEGACPLRWRESSQVVEEALLYFDGIRYSLDESVVMPNHVHTLFKPIKGWRLKEILHSWKSFTALRVNELLGQSGLFWFHESFDRIVRDWAELERVRQYIRGNPVNAGLHEGEFTLVTGIGLVS